jgi:hypothetical protein
VNGPYEDNRAAKIYGPAPAPRRKPAQPPRQRAGLVRLSDAGPARPIRWLWPGWLPLGNLVMIDGDPGVGKSTIAEDIVARATRGKPWPDGQKCRKTRALYLTAEEGINDTVLPRVLAAGGDPASVFVLTHIPLPDGQARLPSIPADIEYLSEVIREYGIRLVVLDVLASYLGGNDKVNSHQDTDVRRALYPLFKMAEKRGVCVIMLRHLNKQGSISNALYRGGGSIGISGQARAVHLAACDPDDKTGTRRILVPVKVNNRRRPAALAYRLESAGPADDTAHVVWLGEDRHTAEQLLAEQGGADERDERDHVVAWVQDYLLDSAGFEAPYAQIQAAARQAGISERTLRNARRRAAVGYRRAGWQSGTVWVLDAEAAAELKAAREAEDPDAIEAIEASPVEAAPMAPMDGGKAD